MINNQISDIANSVLKGNLITKDEAQYLLTIKGEAVYDLLYWANRIRFKYFRNNITLCALLSVKQGGCSEDCKFCAQSSFYKTTASQFPLVDVETFAERIYYAEEIGADSLGLVTSGYSLNANPLKISSGHNVNEFERFCNMAENTSKISNIPLHASIGCMTEEMAYRLVRSGIEEINHNLETSRNHFPSICTTHTYDERLSTIRNAKKAGLKICSGGIFGIGETHDDILALAFELRGLDVDTIPLNFLNPIPGTPLYNNKSPLTPMEILKIVACFRFILPEKEIKVAGGRETNLRDLQSWMFYAGANSAIIGDYLTTKGRKVSEDHQMIRDLGLTCRIKDK